MMPVEDDQQSLTVTTFHDQEVLYSDPIPLHFFTKSASWSLYSNNHTVAYFQAFSYIAEKLVLLTITANPSPERYKYLLSLPLFTPKTQISNFELFHPITSFSIHTNRDPSHSTYCTPNQRCLGTEPPGIVYLPRFETRSLVSCQFSAGGAACSRPFPEFGNQLSSRSTLLRSA